MQMARGKRWTEEDKQKLCELWGVKSIPKIADALQRSENAILIKAHKRNLGAFLESGDYISLNQLLQAVTGSKNTYSCKTTSWVKNRGLPVKLHCVKNNRFRVVHLADFWKWAEQSMDFLDFSKFEENSLGMEPEWVKKQRRLDFQRSYAIIATPWTSAEDKRLISYLQEHRYSYLQLSQMLHRSSGAIQRRFCDLGVNERPVKADNMILWTAKELQILADLIHMGFDYEMMGRELGKSGKAIRGKVGALYKTERLDTVRSMMVDPFWGSGAPVPTVFQAKRTSAVKQQLSQLAGLLLYHRNQLAFDGYWQKDMCQHWDDVKGCTAEQTDCDNCTCFQRIREQCCRRCGATVFSRTKLPDRLCQRCRQQRKQQYFKKMKALGRGVDEKGTISSGL